MSSVILIGANRPLGQRVRALLDEDPGVDTIVDVDDDAAELKRPFEGAACVLHLASTTPVDTSLETGDVDRVRRVLDAAGASGVAHVVLLSDATAYGAWPNNPVPLTEDAPLRPNPGFLFAAERAEIERLALEWRDGHPGATVTVLRPVPAMAARAPSWLVRALRLGSAIPAGEDEPSVQFVHLDDLAAAVDLARRRRLDGAFNVAPDGWIPGDQVRALLGGGPRVPLSERAARRLTAWRWRWGFAAPPPELVPYAIHPWVVANDRLEAAGWVPTSSNEETLVDAHEAGPWATLSPRRRQELALGASVVVLAALVVGVVALVRRRLRATGSAAPDVPRDGA